MGKRQAKEAGRVRPNIRISHTLNGRVKDHADENDQSAEEAYREIIESGLWWVQHGDDVPDALDRLETALTEAETALEQQDGDGIADALKTAQGALQDAQEVLEDA